MDIASKQQEALDIEFDDANIRTSNIDDVNQFAVENVINNLFGEFAFFVREQIMQKQEPTTEIQAARQYYKKFIEALRSIDFVGGYADPCLMT